MTVRNREELGFAIARARTGRGPWMIVAKVRRIGAPREKLPLDCVFIKQRFMRAIGAPEDAARSE